MKTREIETKYLIRGSTLESVNALMAHFCSSKKTRLIYGFSRDTYWHTSLPGTFVRMRERDGIRQLTVKVEDKGSSEDRLEIDLDCTSQKELISQFNTSLFGTSAGVVEKKYYVYWLEETTVCCYQCTVDGVEKSEIIIEVEGKTLEEVTDWTKKIVEFFRIGIEIEKAPGSLYTMYLADQNPHLNPKLPKNLEYSLDSKHKETP